MLKKNAALLFAGGMILAFSATGCTNVSEAGSS